LPRQAKIAPITQHAALSIQTHVHHINHYTFPVQTSQNCVHQMNHYTSTVQKMSFSRFGTRTNRFQLCRSSPYRNRFQVCRDNPSDFNSVAVTTRLRTVGCIAEKTTHVSMLGDFMTAKNVVRWVLNLHKQISILLTDLDSVAVTDQISTLM
jgi:hypothetical protein